MHTHEMYEDITVKKKAVAQMERALHETERALQLEEALVTLEVCGELEQGKARYSNDLVRKAEITRRLFARPTWQDLVQRQDILAQHVKELTADIGYYAQELAYAETAQD